MGLDNDDIKQLIAILQKGLSDDKVSEKPTKKNAKKTQPSKPKRENKFDGMPEFRMHKDDVAIDKRLQKLPPVPRDRDYRPTTVTCRVCGKQETIDPGLVESIERFKCNKCSTSSG
jgi:hypothetical protein